MSDKTSQATTVMVAGIMGLTLPVFSLCFTPLFFLSIAASAFALKFGSDELKAISAGELPEEGRMQSMIGMGTGAFGCLFQLGLFGSYVTLFMAYIVLLLNM